jgi:hypothetical protein
MNDSPYRPPQPQEPGNEAPAATETDRIQRVTKSQRNVLVSLLVYIVFLARVLSQQQHGPADQMLDLVVGVGISIFAITSAFSIVRIIDGTNVAIIFGLLAAIPGIAIIILLIVNQKAVSFLQVHGVDVGFLGNVKRRE